MTLIWHVVGVDDANLACSDLWVTLCWHAVIVCGTMPVCNGCGCYFTQGCIDCGRNSAVMLSEWMDEMVLACHCTVMLWSKV